MAASADQERIRFIIVDEDIRAFCGGGADVMRPYFHPAFVDYDARNQYNPLTWRVRFASADAYLQAFDGWARSTAGRKLKEYKSAEEFVRKATILAAEDVQITGNCAIAAKRFSGEAADERTGKPIAWHKTVVYLMRKIDGDWKVTGMISNLPPPESP